jgi:phosphoribosylformylglycinamidine synthase
MKPTALILRTAGTNCDEEAAFAFELAGFATQRVHINRLLESPRLMKSAQTLAIPGGFSYGDDIAAGKIFATQIAGHLRDAFADFIAGGKPMIGICNGFQVLVKTDLLPGPIGERTGQTCTLTNNDNGRFIDRWVHLAGRSSKCIWTAGLAKLELPIAHGEGKFVCADEQVRQALHDNDQIALVYAQPEGTAAEGAAPANPNGSVDDIAGVCDASGLVLGLMPHPERHISALQHPAWTSQAIGPNSEGPGLKIFRNAFDYVRGGVGAGV